MMLLGGLRFLIRKLMTSAGSSVFLRGTWIGGFVFEEMSVHTWIEMVTAQCSTLKFL
jgi:hypothetical protein